MDERHEQHREIRIQALFDGELNELEASAVRDHLEKCGRCASIWADMESVRAALPGYTGSGPLRPAWPAVRDRLEENRASRMGVAFRLGTSLAAAAGILIGLYVSSFDSSENYTDDESWAEFGSLLGSEEGATLDYLYLTTDETGGESS
jgi:anti-sigma factor RsiW